VSNALFYLGAAIPAVWGVAHLFPTRGVVRGFGDISVDNERVITMEWITEGATLIFIGTIISAVTLIDASATVSEAVYWLCVVMLNVLSVVSLFTGFRVRFIAYRLCPVIFTGSSLLLLAGLLL
jgi:uncharacterized membrane protein YiaA